MKVLILANNSGGLFLFRSELMKELKERGAEVVVSTPSGDRVEKLKEMGVAVIETNLERRGMNPLKDFSVLKNYFKVISREKPDLVITYTIKPNIYGGTVCRLKRIPYAVNITGLGTAFNGYGFLRKMVTVMYKFAAQNAKTVFFENAANMQTFLDDKIIRKEQAVLLNGAGVNLDKFSVLPYPQDFDETRFLFIGRVMAEKGIDELFSAMRMLIKEGTKCSLDLLGGFDENYAEEIKAAEAEGWLRYHGFQEDVRPFIRNCHCFVLPSWHEGMANTNLECASSGRPVITSNIPGCKEAVLDGVSGLLSIPKDAVSLHDAMKSFAELNRDERILMGTAGRRHMEAVFDKKKVVEETIKRLF